MKTAFQELQSGTYEVGKGAVGEIRPWSYYDEVTLATGNLNLTLFADALGTNGKTLSQTNSLGRSIPQGTHLAFDAVKLFYIPAAAKSQAEYVAIITWMANARLVLGIDNKSDMFQYKLIEIFGEALPMIISGAAAGDQITSRSLTPGSRALFGLIILAALTGYTVQIQSVVAAPAAVNGDRIIVDFLGAKKSIN